MDNINMKTKTRVARPTDILKMVEDELNLFNLKTKKRTRELSQARFIYFKLARKFCSYSSLAAIGRAVKRDHATVLNGLKKFDTEAKYDSYMNTVYNKIYSELDEHYVPPQPPPSFKDVMQRINVLEQKLNQILENGS
tara:strand:- start:522 stop:935 length:414 start_codon:yes stop_codon:yes gene_type:complete